MACSLTSRAKPKEKVVNAIETYIKDAENNHFLDREEIKKIIEAVHELYEGKSINENESKRKVEEIMKAYDKTETNSEKPKTVIEALSMIQNDIKIAEYFNKRSIECQIEPHKEDEYKIAQFLKNRQS